MIQETPNNIFDPKYMAIIVSTIIAVCGWIFSSYINTRTFKRNEVSKLKDKISSMLEALFDSIELKSKNESITEAILDDIIAVKLALIELHINHLNKKINIELVPALHIKKIRSEPYDYLSDECSDFKDCMSELKLNTLELIEDNYTNWYFKNSTEHLWKSLIGKIKKITAIIPRALP